MAEALAGQAILTEGDAEVVAWFLPRVPFGAPVRALALGLLDGERPGKVDAYRLVGILRRPDEWDWRTRVLSAVVLRNLDTSDLSDSERKEIAAGLEDAMSDPVEAGWALNPLLRALVGLFTYGIGTFLMERSRKDEAMVRGEAVRSMAVLSIRDRLWVLEWVCCRLADPARHAHVQPHLYEALKTLLPQFTPDDYGRVLAHVEYELCQLLGYSGEADETLILAILGYLEVCGTGSAAGMVAECATRYRSEVRARAMRVATVLYDRLEKENQPHRLLRAASVEGSDGLLRAASGGVGADETLLLRTAEERDG